MSQISKAPTYVYNAIFLLKMVIGMKEERMISSKMESIIIILILMVIIVVAVRNKG